MTTNKPIVDDIPSHNADSVRQLSPVRANGINRHCDHLVQFYESHDVLMDLVASFVGDALAAGDGGAVIGTREHRSGVERRLIERGIDLVDVVRRGRYTSGDADEVMSAFMVDGMPDRQRFNTTISGILSPLITHNGHAHVFGEMVALLVERGSFKAAIALEELWNELLKTHAFSLLCAYPMDHGGGREITEMFGAVMDAHTHVLPAESFMALMTQDERLREIALLQQKALWLEREIVERRHAEERLTFALASEREARAETETALQLRDEFLSIAAHELKTPLTGLNGHVQLALRMLERTNSPAGASRISRSLAVIDEQSRKLSRLLDQLLDTTRLESGRLTIDPRPADVADLVRQVVATARMVSNRHPIVGETPETLEAEVDALRLEQVVMNLLDNAIRHTPAGSRIEVLLARTTPGWIELAVRDDGPGIPAEFRERIFDRYYRLHGDHRASGMGLGLHICREIVELHGGSIWVECPDDGGACFVARLPVRVEQPAG